MIDEKKLLERLKERERTHMRDYEAFSDEPETQIDIANYLQELQEIMEIVRSHPKTTGFVCNNCMDDGK